MIFPMDKYYKKVKMEYVNNVKKIFCTTKRKTEEVRHI